MDFKKEILKILEKYSKQNNWDITWNLKQSGKDSLGHFALPLFPLAKIESKNLEEIFQDLLDFFNSENSSLIVKIEFLNGFANFYIKEELWQNDILEKVSKNKLIDPIAEDFNVMLEYSSPNPGKSFHIGHLRNTLIGLAVGNLYKAQKISIKTANYLNDTGLHIAKLVWYLMKEEIQPEGDLEDWLANIYVKVSGIIKDQPELDDEIRVIYHKIENEDEKVWQYVNKLKEWSLSNFKEIYKDLSAEFDYYFYDSELLEAGKSYVEDLLKKGIAYKDDGATIVNLEKYNLTNALILKSDGTALYITKDLALARKRFDLFDIHKLIYVVGVEQRLHFQQIFKILELDGFKQAKQCEHLSYEMVDLPEGKMSSRKGNVVTYRHLRDELIASSLKEIQSRYPEESEDWQNNLAEKIALAALKIWILKYDNNKKILFKVEDALDFQGDTGPYLLYTVARLNSLFTKVNIDESVLKENLMTLEDEASVKVYKSIYLFNEIVDRARRDGRPSVLTNYLLELAKVVNHYYHDNPVGQAETEELAKARAALFLASQSVLKAGLKILGIETVERM